MTHALGLDGVTQVGLFFVQAKTDVVEQRYPCNEHDSITLAALLAQVSGH